ncbi:unnamed protein product, partial [Medioppia subpectinata]
MALIGPGFGLFHDFDDMDIDDMFGLGGPSGRGGGGGGNAFRSQSFHGSSPSHGLGGGGKGGGLGGPVRQDPPIEHDLFLTLEEVLRGCVKRMKITRRVPNPDGKGSQKKEDKVLTINVRPGWKAGTKVTFQREGDHNSSTIPADIVFMIKDKPHPVFKRDGVDLKYTAKVSLKEALCGCKVNVPTLSGELIPLRLSEVVRPTTQRRIPGHGLPHAKDTAKRGDIVVTFDIKFPDSLNEPTRQILWDCLP